jgi:hypothetical protein
MLARAHSIPCNSFQLNDLVFRAVGTRHASPLKQEADHKLYVKLPEAAL